ncbi:hypothetical protein HDV00_011789 [Rhizophlyctis rosea]|nr:hypothetical protein HDV00_011789 [Rhizophlyctis rosea]
MPELPANRKRPRAPEGGEDDGFADSRGSKSDRKQTEEGYTVFYNDELKIGEGSGVLHKITLMFAQLPDVCTSPNAPIIQFHFHVS